MTLNPIDTKKDKNQHFDTSISQSLSGLMKTQFEASITQFQKGGSTETSPLQKLMNFSSSKNLKFLPQNPSQLSQPMHKLDLARINALSAQKIKSVQQINESETDTKTADNKEWFPSSPVGSSDPEIQSIIQEASRKHGVPVALINAVIKQESNFNLKAQSHAGAQGLMQLMPATGKSYGCNNPFDARENIMAGTHFLSDLLAKYKGNVKLSLAGYNAGPGNVAKYGNTIPPFKETQNYVQKVSKYYETNLAAAEQSSQKFMAMVEKSSEQKQG